MGHGIVIDIEESDHDLTTWISIRILNIDMMCFVLTLFGVSWDITTGEGVLY